MEISSLLETVEDLAGDDHVYTCGICDREICFEHDEDYSDVISHLQNHAAMYHE